MIKRDVVGWFERTVVFPVARLVPQLVAVAAVVGIVVAVGLGVYSMVPPPQPELEVPAAIRPVGVTAAEVLAQLAPSPPSVARRPEVAARPTPTAPVATSPSQAAVRLAGAIDSLRMLLEGSGQPWEGGLVRDCVMYRAGVCLARRTRRVGSGPRDWLLSHLQRYDTERGREQVLLVDTAVRGGYRAYRINASNADEKLSVLAEISSILRSVPDTLRSDAVRAWIDIRRQAESNRRLAVVREEERVQGVNAAREASRLAAQAKRERARQRAKLAALASVAGLLAAGLLLAHLAVERNTRLLQRLIQLTQTSSADG